MALTVDLTRLFRSDNSLGQMHERDVMREWLSTNIGPYIAGANIGEGWKMGITDVAYNGRAYWYVLIEDDALAIMFKLRFS